MEKQVIVLQAERRDYLLKKVERLLVTNEGSHPLHLHPLEILNVCVIITKYIMICIYELLLIIIFLIVLDKIHRQNSIIIKKLDQLLSSQSSLDNRIKVLENNHTNTDESFINVIYKIYYF